MQWRSWTLWTRPSVPSGDFRWHQHHLLVHGDCSSSVAIIVTWACEISLWYVGQGSHGFVCRYEEWQQPMKRGLLGSQILRASEDALHLPPRGQLGFISHPHSMRIHRRLAQQSFVHQDISGYIISTRFDRDACHVTGTELETHQAKISILVVTGNKCVIRENLGEYVLLNFMFHAVCGRYQTARVRLVSLSGGPQYLGPPAP
jgi:hypothetical protein